MSRVSAASTRQSLTWGEIDRYTLLPLGNGDIAGTFDPFGGTSYDELRHGTGATRDIRTLLLSRLFAQDYWEFECWDQHFLDPRNYRVTPTPAEEVRGAPVEVEVRPDTSGFPDGLADHHQELVVERGTLITRYRCSEHVYHLETFIHPDHSLLVYHLVAGGPVRFAVRGTAGRGSPEQITEWDRLSRRHENVLGKWRGDHDGNLWVVDVQSNSYCTAAAAVWSDRGVPDGEGFLLPSGESTVVVAIGHDSLRHLGRPRPQAIALARQAARAGYATLRAEHETWWRRFWEQSWVELPDDRMEGMWHRSLYYLASAAPRRIATIPNEGFPGCFPAFHALGIQDATYGLFALISSGHPELARGEVEGLLEGLPVCKAVARHIYHLEGARFPWHAGAGLLPFLQGHPAFGYPLHEHHVNGWAQEAVYRYLEAYDWRRDLAERYYPILAEIARFWSSMLTERDGALNIEYLPATGQEETTRDYDQPNIFDMLAGARRSMENAAAVALRLGADAAEAERWRERASRLSFRWTQGADGIYYGFEGDLGHEEKCPAQLIGLVQACYLKEDPEAWRATYDYLRRTVNVDVCAWTPGYYAIAAARMGDAADALHCLTEVFRFSRPPWIMFRENVKQVPGRMPYYLAAHGLFVQGINEMLLQSWSGEVKGFPSCPFETAAFRLRAGKFIVEGEKRGEHVSVRQTLANDL
jgi:hypothetical protein